LQAAFAQLLDGATLDGAERTLLSGSVEPLARAIAALQKLRADGDAAGKAEPAPVAGQAAPLTAPQSAEGRAVAAARLEALPPRVATIDTVGDVALRSVRYLTAEGERTFTVRLVPASLGEVRIDVTQALDGALTVRMASANAEVRQALEAQLQSLRQSLAREQGQAVEVAIAAQMGGGQDASRSHGGRAAPQGAAGGTTGNAPGRIVPAQPAAGAAASRAAHHNGALNLFV
jgi:flagellar hook-length control protein FliK